MDLKGYRGRPLFSDNIVQLENMVSANPDNAETLQTVLAELEHRCTDRSVRLKQKVRKALKRCLAIDVTSDGIRAIKPGGRMPTDKVIEPSCDLTFCDDLGDEGVWIAQEATPMRETEIAMYTQLAQVQLSINSASQMPAADVGNMETDKWLPETIRKSPGGGALGQSAGEPAINWLAKVIRSTKFLKRIFKGREPVAMRYPSDD